MELGSDFTPSPSPSSDDSRSSAFVPKDEPADLDDDIKPDLSGEEDTKPAKKRKTTKNTPSPAKKNGGSKGGAWTGNEDWAMFTLIHPKVGTSWAAVAEAVGRDAKVSTRCTTRSKRSDSQSCQNRYAVISKRLEPAIKSISGA